MKAMNFKSLMNPARATVFVASLAFIMSCTKGGGISGNSAASSITGSLGLTAVYPTSAGPTWTPITASNRFYIKGLDLTVTGTCTRGIVTIQANEGGSNYSETASCGVDGTFTFSKTYTAGSGEGDKTLHFLAVDSSGLTISGATLTQDVRIDNTPPAVPVVTSPASTPYLYAGAVASYDITGTVVVPDCDHLTGPGGVTITPDATTGAWSYTATLVSGASLNFTFYSWDLAGNQSAGTTQNIQWSPTVVLYAAGVYSGGPVTDGSTGFSMEASHDTMPGTQTDAFTSFSLLSGFNYITNTLRGL